jgi:hypothetical protein
MVLSLVDVYQYHSLKNNHYKTPQPSFWSIFAIFHNLWHIYFNTNILHIFKVAIKFFW